MQDDEEISESLAKLTELQITTLRLVAVLRAELRVAQAALNAMQIRDGMPADDLLKALRDADAKFRASELEAINGWLLSKEIIREWASDDPRWDRPEEPPTLLR